MGCASFKFIRNGSWSFPEITISLWYTENAEDHLKIAQPNLCGFSYSVVDQWKCSGLPFQTNTKQNPDTNTTLTAQQVTRELSCPSWMGCAKYILTHVLTSFRQNPDD